MKLLEQAERIRIYTGEDDKFKGRPIADYIVEEARKLGLAGATVFRGLSGFGANSLIHTSKVLRLSEDLPVVIEIIDHPKNIDKIMTMLDAAMTEGMVTRDPVNVISYRHNNKQ